MKHFLLKNCLLILSILFYFDAYGQQKSCDCPPYNSLEKEIRSFFISESLDSNEIKRLLTPLLASQNEACVIKKLEFLAELAWIKRHTDSLDIYIHKINTALKNSNCVEKDYFEVYMLWSNSYYLKANFELSLNYIFKALSIAEDTKNDYNKALCLLKIAQIFNRTKQSDRGIHYARLSVPITQKLPPSVEKAQLLYLTASRYYFYYQDSENQNCLDSTLIFTKEAKTLAHQLNNRKILIQAYSRLESIEAARKNYHQGLVYNDSVLMYCVPNINNRELYVAYGDRGDKYMELGNYPLAKRFADSAVFYAKKSKELPAVANATSLVFEIAKRSGNWKDAAIACEYISTINDSILSLDKTKAINELEKKYDQEKNEKTIKELAQEKRIYLLLALAALLGIVIFMFYMRQQALKHKHTVLETEQRLNRARMNPHFFFNALTSLQSFALRENDGKTLASNLSKFSHIMRETLESTYKEYVTIEQEIEFLNEYLEIQKIRFPKKFSYKIEADSNVEIDEILIPSMIIQPFVENSIEHGFAGIDEEGLVNVHFKKVENEVLIEISDNGRGLSSSTKITNEHISRASQIIKDRIYLLNIKLKTKARFSIDNKPNDKGVFVRIYLPQMFENESINH